MVSSTLCPALHILGSQNVYCRAKGHANHYWPWAVFFSLWREPPLVKALLVNHEPRKEELIPLNEIDVIWL